MIALKLMLAVAALALSCEAFAPPASKVSSHHRHSPILFSDKKEFDVKDVMANVQNIDLSGITDNFDKIQENVFAGEFGQRGEAYVAVQVFLGLCILIGGVPIIGDWAMLLGGPGLLLAGAVVMLLSVNDLGQALSPWPVPIDGDNGGGLRTDGLFAEMRHPIYAGLLYFCLGFSIATGSANRLLLTALFLYALHVKSEFEEAELEKKYAEEYLAYKEQVPSKFIPITLLENLPWTLKTVDIKKLNEGGDVMD